MISCDLTYMGAIRVFLWLFLSHIFMILTIVGDNRGFLWGFLGSHNFTHKTTKIHPSDNCRGNKGCFLWVFASNYSPNHTQFPNRGEGDLNVGIF